MIYVTPCINLLGTCEEAIHLYEAAFGATTRLLMRYTDADSRDWDQPLTEDQRNLVYHAEITIGDQRLMLSDMLDNDPPKGTALFLTVTFDDAEGVKRAYERLVEGGTVVYPLVSTTYSSCFGSVIDRFGIRWGLMTEQTER